MMEIEPKRSLDLPSRVTIYPSQDLAIEQILNDLMKRCPAHYALLAEVSGQLISVAGERNLADPIVLASLIAGDMAASKEVARVIGQHQHFQFMLREGVTFNTFTAEAGEFLVLFVLVKKDVPLGWARMMINEASHKLAEVMSATQDGIEDIKLDMKQENLKGWVDDALNSLWNG